MTDTRTEHTPEVVEAAVCAVVDAMTLDPFVDDVILMGTTQQDMRMEHYARVALAAMPAARGREPVAANMADLLTKAIGDITAALIFAGKADKVGPWTAPYVEALNEYDANADSTEGEKYLVWSNEHSAWWGRDRCGYTRIIANAGRYDRAEALSIAGTRDGGWHVRKGNPDEAEALSIAGTRDGGWHVRKGNPDEIAIPEQDAIDQYADITRAQEAEEAARARQIGGAA